jgi:hypothetical protein
MSVEIPLVLVLWEDKNFGGSKRIFVIDDDNLATDQGVPSADFNDKASAVGVHPGPNFNQAAVFTVSLFSDAEFQGKELVLGAGAYSDLKEMDFNDCVSSVRFNAPAARKPGLYINGVLQFGVQPPSGAATIAPIPAIVQLYVAHNYNLGGPGSPSIHSFHVATIVETSADIGADYGGQFSGSAVQAKVVAGPNPTATVHLYRETNPDSALGHLQGGGHIELVPTQAVVDPKVSAGSYNLSDYGFASQTKAITIQYENIIAVTGTEIHPHREER